MSVHMDNDKLDADKIKATKIIGTGKQTVIDIDDKKVKNKIQLSQALKDKLILPGGGK